MAPDRLLAEEDLFGHLLVGRSTGDTSEDVDFAFGETARRWRNRLANGLRSQLAVDTFGGRGVRISGLVLAECGMRLRHPLVNLRGLVAALLGPVFPQCRMQRVERRTVLSVRNEECAPRVSRPCPKSRSPEFGCAAYKLAAESFGLRYAVTGKRHLDRGAQQPYPTDAVLPVERHLQRGPCCVAVTLLEPHQCLTRLRVGALLACTRKRGKRTFEIATQSAYL